jgi:hypothetical protein
MVYVDDTLYVDENHPQSFSGGFEVRISAHSTHYSTSSGVMIDYLKIQNGDELQIEDFDSFTNWSIAGKGGYGNVGVDAGNLMMGSDWQSVQRSSGIGTLTNYPLVIESRVYKAPKSAKVYFPKFGIEFRKCMDCSGSWDLPFISACGVKTYIPSLEDGWHNVKYLVYPN